MVKLTQAKLKELLFYSIITGKFYWKVRPKHSHVKVGNIAGCKGVKGYIYIKVNNKAYSAHSLAWFYVYGVWPKNILDHKDHTKHHNWILNLREVTQAENLRNASLSKTNTSGSTGVCWCNTYKIWKAYICVNSKVKNLGRFEDLEDAIKARKAANIKYGYHKNHGK